MRRRLVFLPALLLTYLLASAFAANHNLKFSLTVPQETAVTSVRTQVNLVRAERNASVVAENARRAALTPPGAPLPLVPPLADNDEYLVSFIIDNVDSWKVQEDGPEGVRRKIERISAAKRAQIQAILDSP